MGAALQIPLLALAIAASEGAGASAEIVKASEWPLTVATWLTFLLLVFLMARFGWGPLTKALDEREARIADDVKRAENARAEAEALLKNYNDKLAAARAETDKLIADGRARAAEVAAGIEADAKKKAQETTERALAEIEGERQKAVTQLNRIVADAAVTLASKLMAEELDARKHQKLIESTLSQIGSRN